MDILQKSGSCSQLSHSQPQLELFESRLPGKPYCTDDLSAGLKIRSVKQAVRAKYIQANPPWLRSWLIFDIDRPGAAYAWDYAGLPEPAWTAINSENGHAHLSWGLEAPVLLGNHDRQEPMRYLAAVESAISVKLEADVGYSGLITKNPAHSSWDVLWGRNLYDLGQLSEYLDLDLHKPKRSSAKALERNGIGRNVSTFDHLRFMAYREVRGWKAARTPGVYVQWLNYLHHQALDYTHNEHPTPLDRRECHWIAKSVAHWVWARFDIAASDKRFSELQANRGQRGGKRSGEVRREASEDQRASARLMRAKGMSIRQIAQDLGIPKTTISRWCSDSD